MVASWGYSMVLTTWVRVVKVSPKTLLVEEIEQRSLSNEEHKQAGLQTGYLSFYVVPLKPITATKKNGEAKPQFRLFSTARGKKAQNDEDGSFQRWSESTWHGYPDDFSTKLFFQVWDGKPQHEDHCD